MPKKTEWVTLTPAEIGDHFQVEVSLEPRLPQDELQAMQLVQAYRTPGPNGVPLMSDEDLLTKVARDPHAEATLRRARLQALAATDPEIQQIAAAAGREEWKRANPAAVKAWEKAQNPDPDAEFEKLKKTLTPEAFDQLVQAAAEMRHAQMMGADPGQVLGAAQAQAAQQEQMALAPPTAQPFREAGPLPEVAPTQFGMAEAPQPMAMTPDVLATQMRRGRPQP